MQSHHNHRTAHFLCAAALLTGSVACNTVIVDEQSGETSKPILNGDPPSAPHHAAVVSLHSLFRQGKNWYVSSQIFCSGTLIAPDVVLTAAHCAAGRQASRVAVYVGDEPAVDITSHLYTVSELLVHPGYSSQLLFNDIALLRLTADVSETAPVAHLSAADALSSADFGATLNFAGFGEDENGQSGVKLQVDGELAGFGCGHPSCSGADDPATQIWYYQDAGHNGGTEEGPCFGDSGGPAFAMRATTPYVAGITSWGDSNCTAYGVSTRVDAYQSFIDDFVSGSGGGGGGGGACTLGQKGDACDSGADCCSNNCAGKPGSRTCK